jgi:eukaryotic-like serine/threonine-protein kinase
MIIGHQYKIVSELGSGGMGVVYQAVDMLLEREVAVKQLRSEFSSSPDVARRFLREAKIQARLNHPNITQLFTCVQQGDTFYIVMEFIAGTPLNRLIPLSYERLLPLALQVLDTLDYAHSMGVLHRDIKPDNLMVTPAGSLKIMDFGIAHVLGSIRHTREKTIMGTLEYISPERIAGKAPDRRSDIYSLGAVLFEALTGKLPFESQSEYGLLRQHMEAAPPKVRQLVPECPQFMEELIDRALAKDPDHRFATCRDMKDVLATEIAKLPNPLPRSGPLLGGDASDEVERCRRRVAALVKSGDTDLAQRVLDSARMDYPGYRQIEQMQQFLDGERKRLTSDQGGTQRTSAAELLRELRKLEKKNDRKGALEFARRALEEHPDIRALQLAVLHLKRKNMPGSYA